MRRPTRWESKTQADPQHSHWFVERFRTMTAEGKDLAGEARLIDAMAPRGARILDAGCGSGRVGGRLAPLGHEVVGVDVDPVLIAAAQEDYPGPTWLVGDLAELDLAAVGHPEPFDLVVCAGNVMPFLAPGTEIEVLRRLAAHSRPQGRTVIGFGAGRGYAFEKFFADVEDAALRLDSVYSSWDLRPFSPQTEFVVAVLSRDA
ncbi:MAG: class I SAM-dependent methyltransferase [Actinomycetales bacterium]|nr:class I SAM-dependent methyltransferase [Actinomycetales bacterium]